jgi:hypothetical protein
VRSSLVLSSSPLLTALLLAGCGEVNSDPDASGVDAVPAARSLVDDVEDGDTAIPAVDGRVGYWYALNDGTGTQTPAPGMFTVTPGGAGGSQFSLATHGFGFSEWGAKIGVYLHHDGGDHPTGYDASPYAGIHFRARGDRPIRVRLMTEALRGDTEGGACDTSIPGCRDYHGQAFALRDDWTEYTMAFADMTQEGWGRPIAFDAGTVVGVDFVVATELDFELAVDDLAFY